MLRMSAMRLQALTAALISSSSPPPKQSDPITTSKFKIIDKKPINHDCYIYKLAWAGPKFKLRIGQHFRIIENIPTYEHPQGQEVIRKYTPISSCEQQNLIQLLIKIYRPNVSKAFPNGGKLTPYLQKLQVGDLINVDGPFGRFSYKPGGIVVVNGKEMKKKRIFFIAGGSGITPCYQTIREIAKMPDQKIELVLLFSNKTESDIILKKQLQQLQPRLKLVYALDVAPEKWGQYSGYVTKQILSQICSLNDPETLYIHCGPKGMNMSIKKMFSQFFPNSTLFKY